MLGEKIGEVSGKQTGQRVLPSEGGAPKVETSFQSTGKLLGVDIVDTVTYSAMMRPDGTLYGEGQAVIMSKEGDAAIYTGQGFGRFGPGGSVSFRGAFYFQSATGKLARLNSTVAVFEHEDDGTGNNRTQIWEWK